MKKIFFLLSAAFFIFSCGKDKVYYSILDSSLKEVVCLELSPESEPSITREDTIFISKKNSSCNKGRFFCLNGVQNPGPGYKKDGEKFYPFNGKKANIYYYESSDNLDRPQSELEEDCKKGEGTYAVTEDNFI